MSAFNADTKASTVAKRSLGDFDSTVISADSTAGGTVSRSVETRGTGSRKRFAMIACAVAPVYGGSPASISYNTQPSAYRSLRPSRPSSPIDCSGLMYTGVPSAMPVCVNFAPPAPDTARAMPKSATIAWLR